MKTYIVVYNEVHTVKIKGKSKTDAETKLRNVIKDIQVINSINKLENE